MSKKISVDLTDENAGALYQNKKVHGLGYGPTINMLMLIRFDNSRLFRVRFGHGKGVRNL